LINEFQIQDSTVLDEEAEISQTSKIAKVCKLARIPQDIWNSLSLDAKKCLLSEHKHLQQENQKLKRSSLTNRHPHKSSVGETNNFGSNSNNAQSICKSEKCSERGG
jgi:hypothetical protein